MKRSIVVAAALAAFGAAHAQEATPWNIPAPSPTLTRADVLAELREWRQAGAWDAGTEAGPGEAVLARRVAMNRLAAARYARAQALEQQRMAAEAAAQEQARLEAEARQREQMLAQSPPAAGPEAAPAAAPVETIIPPASDPPAPGDRGAMASPDAAIVDSRGAPPSTPLATEPMPAQAPPPRETLPYAGTAPETSRPSDAAPPPQADAAPQPQADAAPQPQPQARPTDTLRPSGDNAYGYREPPDKYGLPPLETEPAQAKPVQ